MGKQGQRGYTKYTVAWLARTGNAAVPGVRRSTLGGEHLPTVGSISLSSHVARRIEWLAVRCG